MNQAQASITSPRDITHFLTKRVSHPGDDLVVGDLLIRAFVPTYQEKLSLETCESRRSELRDIESRRRCGVVYVLELGYRIIGTFALISPNTEQSQAWLDGAGTLRCVAIDPDFRGYGFSSELLKISDEVASAWKLPAICLHVQEGADSVARLYRQHGYVRDPRGDSVSHGQAILGYSKAIPSQAAS